MGCPTLPFSRDSFEQTIRAARGTFSAPRVVESPSQYLAWNYILRINNKYANGNQIAKKHNARPIEMYLYVLMSKATRFVSTLLEQYKLEDLFSPMNDNIKPTTINTS